MAIAKVASINNSFEIVVRSRAHIAGDYLEWIPRVALAPFTDDQLNSLAERWLDPTECERFRVDLQAVPDLDELIHVPLLANLTLAIFHQMGALPESRVRLYEIFIELLCGGWDAAKNIRRDSHFGSVPKRTVITRLAWIVHSAERRDFDDSDFRSAVNQTLTGLLDSFRSLLGECVEDGIVIRSGDRFAFAHLSFQEFLTARHLNDPKGARQKLILRKYLEGNEWWRDVVVFYATAADDPSEIATWISDVAESSTARSHSRPREIKSRAEDLLGLLHRYHKGFKLEKSVASKMRGLGTKAIRH